MNEAAEIDMEASRRDSLPSRPVLEALVRDLMALLNRSDIALDPAKAEAKDCLSVILVGVQTLLDMGRRDAWPDEDEAIRLRMKELSE